MTRANDIHELIREEAAAAGDRRALQELSGKLEESLGADVPYRPAFKAQLRQQLMAEARRQISPWYRKPAFIGSGLAVAAAAAVLFVGMRIFLEQPITPAPGTPEITANPAPVAPAPQPTFYSLVTDELKDIPVVALPDERLPAGHPGPGAVSASPQGLSLKRLTMRPDAEQFRAMATGLGFGADAVHRAAGSSLSEGSRTLTMTVDGRVSYSDFAPAAGGSTVDAEGARQVAIRFLDRALLPAGQVEVTPAAGGYHVIFTETVEGWPVVNARTLVEVTAQGIVARAEAYLAAGVTARGTYRAVSQSDALAQAGRLGGTFTGADLVWVRTPGEQVVYLQPYWRLLGTDSAGNRVARYLPALQR